MIEIETEGRGLFRLVYASRYLGAERDFDETVRTIIAKSIQNNRVVDVTGFLLAGEGRFLQLLEGPAEAVRSTFERIGRDARHGDLKRISAGPAERRLFKDWNMGQSRLLPADLDLLSAAEPQDLEPDRPAAQRLVDLLVAAGGRHLR